MVQQQHHHGWSVGDDIDDKDDGDCFEDGDHSLQALSGFHIFLGSRRVGLISHNIGGDHNLSTCTLNGI